MYLPEGSPNAVSWIDLTTLAVHLDNGDTQFPFDDGEDDELPEPELIPSPHADLSL